MNNETQLSRYKKLLKYIDEHYKEDISIHHIEEACNYSYRNINRIFEALNHETIGKYIKRTRIEKAAQFLMYSEASVSSVAWEVGFGDVAAFSKAFKNRFNCSPSKFREGYAFRKELNKHVATSFENQEELKASFEVHQVPAFEVLALTYQGSYNNLSEIEKTWRQLENYALKHELLGPETMVLGEIMDDDEISEQIHCRYSLAIVLDKPLTFEPQGFFITKTIKGGKYAKFLHKGPHERGEDTYQHIYMHWITHIKLEMADAPTLEFFLNDSKDTVPENLLTEIYIPVL